MHADLLAMLDKTDQQLRRQFTCPRLGLDLEVRILPANQVAAARAATAREWGDRGEPQTQIDVQALSVLALQHQMASAVYYDGEPVGTNLTTRIDEQTLRHWAGHYSALEDEIDPPLDSWTDEQLEHFVEQLKKKEPGCVASLTTFDGATLRGFALYLADLLAKSETSTSSDASSEKP